MTTSVLRRLEWQDRAACVGLPLTAFFPLSPGVPEAAQAACSACPVAGPCRDYGATQQFGVWAGERRDRTATERTPYGTPVVREPLQPAVSEPYSCQPHKPPTTTTPTEAPAMSKNSTPETPAATADETRAKSTVSRDGEHKCEGCKQTLPAVKFPTKRTESGYERDTTECRACRDARRAAHRAAKGKTAAA